MFKKIFSLISLSVLAVACGKNANACGGDPNVGTWSCDAGSISVNDYYSDLVRNHFVNVSSGNAGEFVTGPTIDISSAHYNVATGQIYVDIQVPVDACGDYDYHNGFNQKLYDLQVMDQNGNVLEQVASNLTQSSYNENTGLCAIYANTSASIRIPYSGIPGQQVTGIRMRAVNLNQAVRNIGQFYPNITIYSSVSE